MIKIKGLPCDMGVYIIRGKDGSVTYIGQSHNIQARVSTHLSKLGNHTGLNINDFDTVECEILGSREECLSREKELIELYHPKNSLCSNFSNEEGITESKLVTLTERAWGWLEEIKEQCAFGDDSGAIEDAIYLYYKARLGRDYLRLTIGSWDNKYWEARCKSQDELRRKELEIRKNELSKRIIPN